MSLQLGTDSNSSDSKQIIVRRKLATGEVKLYQYDQLCGVPIKEYQREYHKVNYVPRTNRIPKHRKLPDEIRSKIIRLHSVGVGQDKIVKLLALEYPEKIIGSRTVSHLIHEQKNNRFHNT